MEQFSLEKWLQDKSRKVVTRDGREVEILKTDFRGYKQIVGVIKNHDNKDDEVEQWDGQGYFRSLFGESKCDLFFADEEEELTEFEKELVDLVSGWCDSHIETPEEYINKHSQLLLDLARKEIEKEKPCSEKQDEQKPADKVELKWKKGNDGEVLYETSVVWIHNETKTLATAGLLLDSNTFYLPISELEKLPKEEFEKQGEQKGVSTQINPSEYINDMGGNGCYLKNATQKPTDKVEPKFKVGDWITNGRLLVGQVTSFDGEYYHYMQEGVEQPLHISNADNWHLWTIRDAKDGDILMANAPFIFNGNLEGGIGCPGAHCAINTLGKFQIPIFPRHWTGHTTTPATKEQYDLLFQKMKEAGYEWDADKKELRKIEQKSNSFKAEHGKYYYCIKDYFSGGKKQASKGDVVQALRGLPIMGLDDASEFFLPVSNMQLNNDIDHIVIPKFRVGDWVVLSSGSLSEILQIVRIDIIWKLYWFDDDSYLPIVDEDCLHLWRPQDAEDGDILVITKDGDPFIFKGFLDKFHPDSPVAYGGIISNGTFDISSGDGWWDRGEISPANKEQRDLLFQKMKEAGYEWDAENKELRKIDKNIGWSEEDEKKIMWLVRLISTAGFRELDNDKMPCSRSELIDWLKSLKERV